MFILRHQPFYFPGKADWVIWHDFFLEYVLPRFFVLLQHCALFSNHNTSHFDQKNVPAETTEHKLGLVGVLTRSMSPTNAKGVILIRVVRAHAPLEEF